MADKGELKARLQRAKQYSSLVREMFKPVGPHDDSGGAGREEKQQAQKKHQTKRHNQQQDGPSSSGLISIRKTPAPLDTDAGSKHSSDAGAKLAEGQDTDALVNLSGSFNTDTSTSHLPYVSPPKVEPRQKNEQPRTAAARPRRSLPTSRKLEYPVLTSRPPRPEGIITSANNSNSSSNNNGSRERHLRAERPRKGRDGDEPSRPARTSGRPHDERGLQLRTSAASASASTATAPRAIDRRPAALSAAGYELQQRPAQAKTMPRERDVDLASDVVVTEGGREDTVHHGDVADVSTRRKKKEMPSPARPGVEPTPTPVHFIAGPPASSFGPTRASASDEDDLDALLAAASTSTAQAEQLMAEVDQFWNEVCLRADSTIRRAQELLLA